METLRHAASDGQLTVDELEERVSAAYAARTRRELDRLTADISGAPLAQAEHALTVKKGPGGTRWVISIMGGGQIRVPHGRRGACVELRPDGQQEEPAARLARWT